LPKSGDKHRCARDYSFGLAVIFLLLAVAALALHWPRPEHLL
jgi:hypothetical protein